MTPVAGGSQQLTQSSGAAAPLEGPAAWHLLAQEIYSNSRACLAHSIGFLKPVWSRISRREAEVQGSSCDTTSEAWETRALM